MGIAYWQATSLPGISPQEWRKLYNAFAAAYKQGDGEAQWALLAAAYPDIEDRRDSNQDSKIYLTVDVECSRCGQKRETFHIIHDGRNAGYDLPFYQHTCHVQKFGRPDEDRDRNRDRESWNR